MKKVVLTGQDASILALFARTSLEQQQDEYIAGMIETLISNLSHTQAVKIARAILRKDRKDPTAKYYLDWVETLR